MHVTFVQANSGVNGETYAHFDQPLDQPFTGLTVPAKGTANSGRFGDALHEGYRLFAGNYSIGTSRCICRSIPRRRMAHTDTRDLRIGDGYKVPWLHLTQLNVPTNDDLAGLSPGDLTCNGKFGG